MRTPAGSPVATVAALWLDPLKPERANHMLGALVCLALSVLAVAYSVVDYFVRFRP